MIGEQNIVDDFEHKQRLYLPRGTDVSQQDETLTVASTATSVNKITPTAGKVIRVTGLNYVDRAHISAVKLEIDEGQDTARTIEFFAPPHPASEFGRVDTFNPPIVALVTADLQVTDDGTPIADFKSLINAFEADQ